MIGYLGDIIFETSDKKICNFKGLKRSISANYSEHKRYKKKSQREFEGAENQDRKSTRLNSSHKHRSRMPSSA